MEEKVTLKKATPAATAADEALLTKDEIEAARRVATEEVKAEHKKRAKAAVIAKFKQEAEAELNPEEATRPITLDLADHQPSLMVDGVIYWHGSTYHVKKATYDTLVEMQSRGWDHDENVKHKSENSSRRPRRPVLSQSSLAMSAEQLLRV